MPVETSRRKAVIVANLATYPARRAGLAAVVAALAPQVDRLNLVLNQYEAPLDELAGFANLDQIIPSEDTKDAGKFYPDTTGADWLFCADDDIRYPPDYVARTLSAMRALPAGRWAGSYHGQIYCLPHFTLRPRSFLRWLRYSPSLIASYMRILDFRRPCPQTLVVDQIGTGVAVIAGTDVPPYAYMRGSQKFVDVRFAKWCFEQGITQVCLQHAAGWLEGKPDPEDGIHRSFTITNPPHVAKEIWTYAMKRPEVGELVADLEG